MRSLSSPIIWLWSPHNTCGLGHPDCPASTSCTPLTGSPPGKRKTSMNRGSTSHIPELWLMSFRTQAVNPRILITSRMNWHCTSWLWMNWKFVREDRRAAITPINARLSLLLAYQKEGSPGFRWPCLPCTKRGSLCPMGGPRPRLQPSPLWTWGQWGVPLCLPFGGACTVEPTWSPPHGVCSWFAK